MVQSKIETFTAMLAEPELRGKNLCLIVMTTLSERRNIVVIADEAHLNSLVV